MRFCRSNFLPGMIAFVIAIITFSSNCFGQFSVTITGPSASTMSAPTGMFAVNATVTNVPNTLNKVVFYRNDVPYQTSNGANPTPSLSENNLGQESYTYRARAFDSSGAWVDSNDVKLVVETPRVFTMGIGITYPSPYPTPSPTPTPPVTHGPWRTHDHTDEIQNAVNHLRDLGGGTLYFPCNGGKNESGDHADPVSIYNIRKTVTIPSNVTLQGESSEEGVGRCQVLWNDVSWVPTGCQDNPDIANNFPLRGSPMFRIADTATHVRIRDMWLYSRSSGVNCYPRYDWTRISEENTVGILLDAGSNDKISDVIVENVAVSNFTYGIKATGHMVSKINLRGIRPYANHRQLFIDANHAYDWDVQNFNISGMGDQQGAVEINTLGAPSSYAGENPKLKFLQLNCNGNTGRTAGFCVSVRKHGGLYFKQLHHEGTNQAIIVNDIPETNTAPIIFEHSGATGEFYDENMKLYLIGNGVAAAPKIPSPNVDQGRLKFYGGAIDSTLIDCGDVHADATDVNGGLANWGDFQMSFTHTERNRESFFAQGSNDTYPKKHTVCPAGVTGVPNINEIGGEHFNTGVLPMEDFLPYTHRLTTAKCPLATCNAAQKLQQMLNSGGSVYIDGVFTITQPVTVPSGSQIIGAPNSALHLGSTSTWLFQINIPPAVQTRLSSIVMRNLTLKALHSSSIGISIVGDDSSLAGGSSDMHFSGLTVEGFYKGLEVRRFENPTMETGHPMIDGVSWKNMRFVGNQIAAKIFSSNVSNWNIMNLSIESKSAGAVGWHQITAGHSMQNVACRGSESYDMEHCIKLEMAATYITGFKRAQHVKNSLTFGENYPYHPLPYTGRIFASAMLRNNDFSSEQEKDMGRINIIGKYFITSMNNRYQYFNVVSDANEGDLSRLTYCGDTYAGGVPYPGLADLDLFRNLYAGIPTPTRISCGLRPKPWEDVINWGGEEKPTPTASPFPTASPSPSPTVEYFETDQPLAGNFYDAVREDLVIYREGAISQFRIKKIDGTASMTTDLGTAGDKPLIGRFFPGANAQVVAWRPSTGIWRVKDPVTTAYYEWNWGTTGDIPFTGNFRDESAAVTGDKEEIAIYRPGDYSIWIMNPRSGQYIAISRGADYGDQIQVGDFLGAGYDQIAQFKNGVWSILDAHTNMTYTTMLGKSGDTPVAGKYLSGSCTQLGIWVPEDEKFIVKDPFISCGHRKEEMIWGSNNKFGTVDYPDDIPLRINTTDGSRHRPTSYRPTKGAFPFSLANGQWWIHDPF